MPPYQKTKWDSRTNLSQGLNKIENELEKISKNGDKESSDIKRKFEETEEGIKLNESKIEQLPDSIMAEVSEQIKNLDGTYEDRFSKIEMRADGIELEVFEEITNEDGTVTRVSKIEQTAKDIRLEVSEMSDELREEMASIKIDKDQVEAIVKDIQYDEEGNTLFEKIGQLSVEADRISGVVSNNYKELGDEIKKIGELILTDEEFSAKVSNVVVDEEGNTIVSKFGQLVVEADRISGVVSSNYNELAGEIKKVGEMILTDEEFSVKVSETVVDDEGNTIVSKFGKLVVEAEQIRGEISSVNSNLENEIKKVADMILTDEEFSAKVSETIVELDEDGNSVSLTEKLGQLTVTSEEIRLSVSSNYDDLIGKIGEITITDEMFKAKVEELSVDENGNILGRKLASLTVETDKISGIVSKQEEYEDRISTSEGKLEVMNDSITARVEEMVTSKDNSLGQFIDTAIENNNNLSSEIDKAKNELNSISSDSVLSVSEKISARREYEKIESQVEILKEQSSIVSEEGMFNLLDEKFSELTEYIGAINLYVDENTEITASVFNLKFENVYIEMQKVINLINKLLKDYSDTVLEEGKGYTEERFSQLKIETDKISGIVSKQTEFEDRISSNESKFEMLDDSISLKVESMVTDTSNSLGGLFDDIINKNEELKNELTEAKNELSNMSSDSILTEFEKISTIREYEKIKAQAELLISGVTEKHDILSIEVKSNEASNLTSIIYEQKFILSQNITIYLAELDEYLISIGLFDEGICNIIPDEFNGKFNKVYSEMQNLINLVNDELKDYTDEKSDENKYFTEKKFSELKVETDKISAIVSTQKNHGDRIEINEGKLEIMDDTIRTTVSGMVSDEEGNELGKKLSQIEQKADSITMTVTGSSDDSVVSRLGKLELTDEEFSVKVSETKTLKDLEKKVDAIGQVGDGDESLVDMVVRHESEISALPDTIKLRVSELASTEEEGNELYKKFSSIDIEVGKINSSVETVVSDLNLVNVETIPNLSSSMEGKLSELKEYADLELSKKASLEILDDSITNRVESMITSEGNALYGEFTQIKNTANEIDIAVGKLKDESTGEEILSRINLTGDGVKIEGKKIVLNGDTEVNGSFKISDHLTAQGGINVGLINGLGNTISSNETVVNAKNSADEAKREAQEAKDRADTANKTLSDISSDSIITPSEKRMLEREFWALAEPYAKIRERAFAYKLDHLVDDNSVFFKRASDVYTMLFEPNQFGVQQKPILSIYDNSNGADMNENSIVDTDVILNTFNEYYKVEEDVLSAISKELEDRAERVAEEAKNDAIATSEENAKKVVDALGKELQVQIDGKIDTWSQENNPATNWTTVELRTSHTGDLWYQPSVKLTRRYKGTGTTLSDWEQLDMKDEIAQSLAQSKKRVFTAQPYTPYEVGDLWLTNTTGTADLYLCKITRLSGNYVASDWIKATKYTDDTKAEEAIDKADNAQNSANTALLNSEEIQRKINEGWIVLNSNTVVNGSFQVGSVNIEGDAIKGVHIENGTISAEHIKTGAITVGIINGFQDGVSSNPDVQSSIGNAKIFREPSMPTSGMKKNDMWYNTSDGNHPYIYDGNSWISSRDKVYETIGGNKVYFQDAEPPKTGAGTSDGDMWFKTNANNAMYVLQNGSWVLASDADDKIAKGSLVLNANTVVDGNFKVNGANIELNGDTAVTGTLEVFSGDNGIISYNGTTEANSTKRIIIRGGEILFQERV